MDGLDDLGAVFVGSIIGNVENIFGAVGYEVRIIGRAVNECDDESDDYCNDSECADDDANDFANIARRFGGFFGGSAR